MIVMKFGGTSVSDATAIKRSISIVSKKLKDKPVIVVSACAKVTDSLYKLINCIETGQKDECKVVVDGLKARHKGIIEECLKAGGYKSEPDTGEIFATIDNICNSLWTLSKAHLNAQIPDSDKAYITSMGEYLSSNIICFMLNLFGIKTAWVNARHFMITSKDYMSASPLVDELSKRAGKVIDKAYKGYDAVITQGFVGVTLEGDPTVLGRGGSDYSASLLGMVLDADRIEIWTDVDGIRTADPRMVENTRGIRKISYEEAAELARFGAKVLHPLCIEPAATKNIPLYVLNSMNPDGDGTVVLNRSCIFDGIKSVSYNENIRVVNIYSPKMINASGFMSKIFDIFGRHGVSVDMISTSEASVSVTVDAKQPLEEVVAELSQYGRVTVDRDKSQVSIIGKNIIGIKGAFATIFEALSDCKIYMMSQGSSFLNLSLVIDRPEMVSIVRTLHKVFFENGAE